MDIENSCPQKVTIIRGDHYFHVMAERYGHVDHAELAYDEMLGAISRMFCPTLSDGQPNRYTAWPLFLEPPKPRPEKTEDNCNSSAPVAPKREPDWPSLFQWRSTGETIAAVAEPLAVIEDAVADAVRLAITHAKVVFLEFNGAHYAIHPKRIIGDVTEDKMPF